MTSIDRTAYPRFKRMITTRELADSFTPSSEEIEWAGDMTLSGYGQDKHETHSGPALPYVEAPRPSSPPGLAARGTACSLKPLTRSFGRKLRVL